LSIVCVPLVEIGSKTDARKVQQLSGSDSDESDDSSHKKGSGVVAQRVVIAAGTEKRDSMVDGLQVRSVRR
jgi:hypothetical protein